MNESRREEVRMMVCVIWQFVGKKSSSSLGLSVVRCVVCILVLLSPLASSFRLEGSVRKCECQVIRVTVCKKHFCPSTLLLCIAVLQYVCSVS